jgi:hypothetical protein
MLMSASDRGRLFVPGREEIEVVVGECERGGVALTAIVFPGYYCSARTNGEYVPEAKNF